MNVLSLFDGMSCGQQALERAGIKVDNYYASEIDKYAIKVTMANYPNTIQLGSVVDVDGYSLPKIDLLIGGSPCQSFSFAGRRKGMSTKDNQEILTLDHYLKLKSESYEFEGQSYLFWEYMRLLNELRTKNPNVFFFLENVEMGEKWEKVLSKAIGVNGIHMNSALVSAQNRKRIYWTNIGMRPAGLFGDLESIIQQPKDKGILLKDVLENEVDEKYFLSQKSIDYINRNERNIAFQMDEDDDKSGCVVARYQSGIPYNQIVVHNTMPRSSTTGKNGTGPLSRADGKTYCLDTGNTNAVELPAIYDDYNGNIRKDGKTCTLTVNSGSKAERNGQKVILDTNAMEIKKNYVQWDSSGKGHNSQGDRAYFENGKCGTLSRGSDNSGQVQPKVFIASGLNENQQKKFNPDINADKANTLTLAQGRAGSSEEYMDAVSKIAKLTSRIRRLTPIECERLQTVKDNYTNYVSDSQRYKMLGNGWTVDIIVHFFNYLKSEINE